MTVNLTFQNPGSKEFEIVSESGPSVVRQKVLRRMVDSEAAASRDDSLRLNQFTPANYDFQLLRLEPIEGRMAYVLEVFPKTKSPYLMRGEVWVDTEDFAISRLVGRPAQSPSFWIPDSRFTCSYSKLGSFWLLASMDSEADVRVFGHTEMQIRYRNYRINLEQEAVSADR